MKLIIILFSLITFLFANEFNLNINKKNIKYGESLNLHFKIEGKNIIFNEKIIIDGIELKKTTNRKYKIKNRNKFLLSYKFKPKKDLYIPVFTAIIDGKKYKTKEMFIKVEQPITSLKKDKIYIQTFIDKKDLYIGEEFKFTFYYKTKEKIEGFEIHPSKTLDKFIKINNPVIENKIIDGFNIQTHTQTYISNIEGKIKITPFIVNFYIIKNNKIKEKLLKTNDIYLNIKKLPDNINLYGEYEITSKVTNKTKEVDKNTPLKLKITIISKDNSNMYNIKPFKLKIPNVDIYYDKEIKNNNNFSQIITIVGSKNYTIPKLNLKYFSKNEKIIKTIQTKKINIKIKNIDKKINKKINKEDYFKKVILILNFIISISFSIFIIKKIIIIEKYDEINKIKNNKELLNYLIRLNYKIKDKYIENEINKIESILYFKKNIIINKKEIIKYLIKNYKQRI